MANRKNHYYVLVFTDNGPKYVTKLLPHQWAEWEETGVPKEFKKEYAQEVCAGLNLNFNLSQVVVSQWEITTQPYNYKDFTVRFEEKKEEED